MSSVGLIVIAAATLSTAIVFVIDPTLDLTISELFFDPARGIFPAQDNGLLAGFRLVTAWVVALTIALPAVSMAGKMLFPARPAVIPGRAMLFILAAITLGPGLVVNAGFKEHSNRPRPGQVTEFGGNAAFKPWWDNSGACRRNCSFVSGESAAAFAMLAPAALAGARWRLAAIGAAALFGILTALLRIMFGGHFFTDVAFAAAMTALLVWLLHGFLYRWSAYGWSDERIEDALAEAGRFVRSALRHARAQVAAMTGAAANAIGGRLGRVLGASPRNDWRQ